MGIWVPSSVALPKSLAYLTGVIVVALGGRAAGVMAASPLPPSTPPATVVSGAASVAPVLASTPVASPALAASTSGVGTSSSALPDDASVSLAIPSRETAAAAEAPPAESSTRGQQAQSLFASDAERNTACETGQARGKPCRVSWIRVLGESFMVLTAQHAGNIWMDKDTRINLTHGSFWGDYVYCVEHYRWSRWKDDDPFAVDYIGHPMMGAITNSIYEQNDPKQRALNFENTRRYWVGRLRATAYSAAYSAQWKVGPLSEASIGNTGLNYYRRHSDGVYTNETGMQDFFVTPVGGLAWNVGEDAIDRYILSHVRHAHPRNRALLFAASFMVPLRSGANLTRFRAPYYRDPAAAAVQ